MDFHCKTCNRSIFENKSEYNINLDEFEKILNNHITAYNKKFDFFYLKCTFEILLNNNSTAIIEKIYHYNIDRNNIKSYLLYYIDSCEMDGYKFNKINSLTNDILSCICNITYKHYMNQPMSMVERQINYIIAKNPQLINSLDRKKNHPLIRKYLHIPLRGYEYNKYY